MGLSEKLKRMEAATYASESCLVCELKDHTDRVFRAEIKRLGVDVTNLPADPEFLLCDECGARFGVNMCGMSASARRAWLDWRVAIVAKVRARICDHELKQLVEQRSEFEERDERQATVFFGDAYPAIKQAMLAVEEAARLWLDEHRLELKQMMSRPPLVERRGFTI